MGINAKQCQIAPWLKKVLRFILIEPVHFIPSRKQEPFEILTVSLLRFAGVLETVVM